MDKGQRKILRSPTVKRKSKVQPVGQRLTLERVLGLTVTSNAALSYDPVNGTIAYPAGCVVVLFNPRRNRQTHIFNSVKKTITSVAFSSDGKHLVTGECGHQPAVRVWDVIEKTQVAEFHGHKFGVNCVAFSPNLKYIVSIGSQHDMMVNVWNWRTGNKVASNKVSSKVRAVAFAADSGCFVTVGNRHVKFWYLDSSKSKINQTVPLLGRSGILGEQKNNFFCDVACGRGRWSGSTFVITQSGLLCEFNEKRLLDKWVELMTKSASCIAAGEEHIYVGCAEGVVRVFSTGTLSFVTSLPHPHFLGVEVATATTSSDMICTRSDAKYPDTIAIALDDDHKKVACIYNDHSLYLWDVLNIRRVGKAWSFLYHSGCIWALEVYPVLDSQQQGTLPPGSFITASSDDTIRVWNLESQMTEAPNCKRNIYSNELLKILYTDPALNFLCDVNYNPAGATDKTDTTWEGKNGVRSIRVSPDGEHLASGDRQGNVRIYDLRQMAEIKSIEAHESDVVCLEYSFSKAGPRILATGSRDRLIHVFDVEQKYGLLQTLDDHSAAIQSVRFTDSDNKLRMLSCGSDKSLLFRNACLNPNFEFSLAQHLVSKATMYDMIIDPTQKFVATACQDRNIRVYNMATAKQKKNYRGSLGDEGVLLRVQLDPSGTYAATSCSDKNLCVLEFYTGELVGTVYGHSEIVTGLRFTNDLKHLISVSADGCVFVWRLPSGMTKTMRHRMEELGQMPQNTESLSDLRREATLTPNPVFLDTTFHSPHHFPVQKENISPSRILAAMDLPNQLPSHPPNNQSTPVGKGIDLNSTQQSPMDYRFSVGSLPNWAKAKFGDGSGNETDGGPDAQQPKGRWAQRFDQNIAFKSQLDLTQLDDEHDQRRFTYGAGGLQTSMPDLRRETVVFKQHVPLKNIPIIDDDDETNIDDDEDFFPAYLNGKEANSLAESDRSSSDYDDRRGKRKSEPTGRRSDAGMTGRKWGSRLSLNTDRVASFDLDDADELDNWSDTTEVIYPPSDSETVDTYASTYQVFAVDEGRVCSKKKVTPASSSNMDEADSETTEPISLEDQDDDDPPDETQVSSSASTPSDPDHDILARTPDKEQFVKENFESVSFTPITAEKFAQHVASVEQAAEDSNSSNVPFSPRLSLSSRFLSRSHFGAGRLGLSGANQRPENWLDMNWRSGGLLNQSPDKDDPPSPPTKLENKEPIFTSPRSSQNLSSPGTCGTPSPRTLRRFWADLSLPQQTIKEEHPLPRIPVPESLLHVRGDRLNTSVPPLNGSKIPLPAVQNTKQSTDCVECNLPSPYLVGSSRPPRAPPSPEHRGCLSPKLVRNHDMRPIGIVPIGIVDTTPPQSPRQSRPPINSIPLRNSRSPDFRSPQSPQTPPLSPKPPLCPSSPRPSRSTLSSRAARKAHSPDVSSSQSPKLPRASLSCKPPRSPDLRTSRSPQPPKKPPRNLPPLKSPHLSRSGTPTSSPSSSPNRGTNSRLESAQVPPNKPPRSSLIRSSSPQSSSTIRAASPSTPVTADGSKGLESVQSRQAQTAQVQSAGSEVSTASSGSKKEGDVSAAVVSSSPHQVPTSPSRTLPPSVKRTLTSSPTQGTNSLTSKENRRSNGTSKLESNVISSGAASQVRQAPSYFRTTKSSRLKSASSSSQACQVDALSNTKSGYVVSGIKGESGAKKRPGRGRLSAAKVAMHASTPNLAACFEEEESKMVGNTTKSAELPSNLRALADLSLSVPDINTVDDPPSTDSSSSDHLTVEKERSGPQQKSVKVSSSLVNSRHSVPPSSFISKMQFSLAKGVQDVSSDKTPDARLMPPPSAPPRTGHSGLLQRAAQLRKRSSELTLEQAKSILLGNSGILGARQNSLEEDSTAASPVSVSHSDSCLSSDQTTASLSSTLKPLPHISSASSHPNSSSCTVFDAENTNFKASGFLENRYSTARTLAVVQEIELTASQQRRERAAGAALSAERFDPPERDQPSLQRLVPNIVPASASCSAFQIGEQEDALISDSVTSRIDALHDMGMPDISVRERIARLNHQTSGHLACELGNLTIPFPRNANAAVGSPASVEYQISPRSQSDTGLGSETDTDSDMHGHPTPEDDLSLQNISSQGRLDRSRLSLQLPKSDVSSLTVATALSQESLQTCASILEDLKSAVQRAKDFHMQLQHSTSVGGGHNQMLLMMSAAFHETHLALAELALQSPASSDDSSKPLSCPLVGEASGRRDGAVIDKARDMLQPFVSQLSRELSDELIKLVKERLERNPS
ncbi:WD repeat-containing protein 62-like isoform X3 [Pomacea canaliculata]|uniref:WD repeat-containing protein 62-like isoform X3 n=1 Tax=Pomacea canaliculata TaxID=400727 RepID=UPI000D725E45|nr:WD repeat-containing protein 62-like isoform X3 [Pomacea canaliculata]